MLNQEKLDLYLSIDWFKNVGREFTKDYNIEIKRVKSWKDANKYNQSVYYGNLFMDEESIIGKMFYDQRKKESRTEWIYNAGKEWDLYMKEIYGFLNSKLLPKIKKANPNIEEENVLYILFLEYMETVVIGNTESDFLRDFFELLKDGYYPCGWNQTTKQFYVY